MKDSTYNENEMNYIRNGKYEYITKVKGSKCSSDFIKAKQDMPAL